MENASKALLMAGGVLIGILLLTLAIYLYASFGGSAETIQKTIEQGNIDQFNNQFTAYAARDCTVYDILSVVNLANNYNKKNGYESGDTDYYVKVEVKNINNNANNLSEEILLKNIVKGYDGSYAKINASGVELYKFSCSVDYSEVTGKVNKIIFSKK